MDLPVSFLFRSSLEARTDDAGGGHNVLAHLRGYGRLTLQPMRRCQFMTERSLASAVSPLLRWR